MSSTNRKLYFFLSNCTLFISFSSLISLVRTPSSVLTAMVRVDNIVFLILGENHSVFQIKFDVGYSFWRCSLWSWGSSIFLIFWEFLLWMGVKLCWMFSSVSFDMILWFFSFNQLIWWITLIDLWLLPPQEIKMNLKGEFSLQRLNPWIHMLFVLYLLYLQ